MMCGRCIADFQVVAKADHRAGLNDVVEEKGSQGGANLLDVAMVNGVVQSFEILEVGTI